jgi:hypothetical protein
MKETLNNTESSNSTKPVLCNGLKPQELRIGNSTIQGKIKNFFENGVHVGYGKCFNFNELQPIPITKDVYYKLEKYLLILDFSYSHNSDKNSINVFINNWDLDFYFLHQIENLYFDLTGDELTIA